MKINLQVFRFLSLAVFVAVCFLTLEGFVTAQFLPWHRLVIIVLCGGFFCSTILPLSARVQFAVAMFAFISMQTALYVAVLSLPSAETLYPLIWSFTLVPAAYMVLGLMGGSVITIYVFISLIMFSTFRELESGLSNTSSTTGQTYLIVLALLSVISYYYEYINTDKANNLTATIQASLKKSADLRATVGALGAAAAVRRQDLRNLEKGNELLSRTKFAVLNLLEDVKDEKQRFEEQVKETQKFASAVEASNDAIMMSNLQGELVYANAAWETLTGYKLDEVKGQNPRFLKSGKTPETVYPQLWDAISQGKTFVTEEIINKRKDGTEYPARLAIYPLIIDGQTVLYVGVQQDISERKRIEHSKNEFISLASHQLRTPLTAVKWYTELLGESESMKGETEQTYVKEITGGVSRMVELIGTLLNISRIDLGTIAVNPSKFDVRELVNTVIKEADARVQAKKLQLEVTLPEAPVAADTDITLAQIVIQNIIENAVKYTPDAGTVKINLTATESDFTVDVADSGIGIPKTQQEHVLSSMFRADNAQKAGIQGTGLGLFMTKKIVEQLKGKISFESEEGKGTTFHITLPLQAKAKEGKSLTND